MTHYNFIPKCLHKKERKKNRVLQIIFLFPVCQFLLQDVSNYCGPKIFQVEESVGDFFFTSVTFMCFLLVCVCRSSLWICHSATRLTS